MSSTSRTQTDVTDAQLKKYAALIYDKTGIRVSPQKQALLSNRLRRRLRALSMSCYDEYFGLLSKLKQNDPEWEAFLQEITTHETYLYRDKNHWDWFQETFLPSIATEARNNERRKTLRIWSAACSTGDEGYTIASCIADRLIRFQEWQVQIIGTDIGVGAVAMANDATFNQRSMNLVPVTVKKRFFEQQMGVSIWKPKPVLRSMVRFQQHNLLHPLREVPFDLVVLKNVLIYFDPESRRKVLENITRLVRPNGYLLAGSAEGIADLVTGFKQIHSWLYHKSDGRPSPDGSAKGSAPRTSSTSFAQRDKT